MEKHGFYTEVKGKRQDSPPRREERREKKQFAIGSRQFTKS
jgi:hypothetical protein